MRHCILTRCEARSVWSHNALRTTHHSAVYCGQCCATHTALRLAGVGGVLGQVRRVSRKISRCPTKNDHHIPKPTLGTAAAVQSALAAAARLPSHAGACRAFDWWLYEVCRRWRKLCASSIMWRVMWRWQAGGRGILVCTPQDPEKGVVALNSSSPPYPPRQFPPSPTERVR